MKAIFSSGEHVLKTKRKAFKACKVLLTFGISAVVHIILVLLIKAEVLGKRDKQAKHASERGLTSSQDSADKFHDYEGLAGKTLLVLPGMLRDT